MASIMSISLRSLGPIKWITENFGRPFADLHKEKLMTPYSFLFSFLKHKTSKNQNMYKTQTDTVQILTQSWNIFESEILEYEVMTRSRDLDYHIVGAENLNWIIFNSN